MALSKLSYQGITSVSNTAISGTIVGTQLGDGIVGQVSFFALNSAPTGWIKANGAAVSRTTYASLFATIGTTFGTGDGSTTFNLPDLRGYFPRGWDDSAGVDSGRSFGTTQDHAIPNITGAVPVEGPYHNKGSASGAFYDSSVTGGGMSGGGGSASSKVANFDASRVVNTSTETRPKNLALLACIKY